MSFFFQFVGALERERNGCGNQFVGENELRGVDRVERQSVFHTLFIRNQNDIAVAADQLAVETLAPDLLFLQRDLRLVPRPVGKVGRTEEHRVGQEGDRLCRSGWSRDNEKKKSY